MGYRVGVDIGGTFTDITVADAEGRLTTWKQDSDPERPNRAIDLGLRAVAEELGLGFEQFLDRTQLLVHGTTIATNTVIQRNGPRVGLLCTEGFRDVVYLRDGFKPERFNLHLEHPVDFVDRYLRFGIGGRIDKDGAVVAELDDDAIRAAAARLREAEVAAVGVAFLWSMTNDAHERRAAEILKAELPGVHVVCSADVLPEIREWQRTSATVLSTYVLPGIATYLRELERMLSESGYGRRPLIMQINGGCASVDEILRRPVNVLASGPAAAPAAALHYASRDGGQDVITFDMGGTSLDVCVIRDGRPTMSRDIQVESQPIGVPAVEVESIGAGGGSLAWIDSGGALRVGPRSAGARPGPACYGAGGTEPAVTDANVVLGYLAPEAFLGGRRTLRDDLSRDAVQRVVGDPLGLDVVEAAAGIIRVVESNMVSAVRAVSVERGIDPRGFALAAGGGAGGLHAARIARELGIGRVVVPREAGTFCAFGMTVTDVRHDAATAHHCISDSADLERIDAVYAQLEEELRGRLEIDGFSGDQVVYERAVDARYPGQVHEITVPAPDGAYGPDELATIAARFHAEHERQFTYSRPELPIEFLHWRVTGVGAMPVPDAVPAPTAPDGAEAAARARVGERDAWFEELGGMAATAVYDGERLVPGATVAGPAIVQTPTTTIVVPPADELTIAADGGFAIAVGALATA
jgi:N-methylhydantoinase A